MNWRDEVVPKEYDKEEQLKIHIKKELMNYYLYLGKWQELENEKTRISNRSIGGSIAKMPEGSQANDGIQHRIAVDKTTIEQEQQLFNDKMNTIKKWLDVLTLPQYKIVKMYVMKYQCRNAKKVSEKTGYAKDTIYQYADEAIERIGNKIKNILYKYPVTGCRFRDIMLPWNTRDSANFPEIQLFSLPFYHSRSNPAYMSAVVSPP